MEVKGQANSFTELISRLECLSLHHVTKRFTFLWLNPRVSVVSRLDSDAVKSFPLSSRLSGPQLKHWDSPNQPRCPTRASRCTRKICTSAGCPRGSLCDGPTASEPPSCARSWLLRLTSSLSSRGEPTRSQSVSIHELQPSFQPVHQLIPYLCECAMIVCRPELLTEQVKQETPSVPVCDSGTSRLHTGCLCRGQYFPTLTLQTKTSVSINHSGGRVVVCVSQPDPNEPELSETRRQTGFWEFADRTATAGK